MYEMVEKANQELEVRYEYNTHILRYADFRVTNPIFSETAFRGANGEINETIAAGRIHANNLNLYLAIQTIKTVNNGNDRK